MKSQIILFLVLITYILSAVTISSVEDGACANKIYTFVIKANSDTNIQAGTATVTLLSPEKTTPTCSYGAVTDNTGRRLTGDFDITCTINSKLEQAEIKVSAVNIGGTNAAAATGKSLPMTMTAKATCEGTATSPTNNNDTKDTTNSGNDKDNSTDAGKFTQISGFLFLILFFIF